jgi:hypothetical protein
MTQITADAVIAAYVKTRDLIDEKKKVFDAEVESLKALQDKRELWLKGELEKLGVESFRTNHGTAFVDWKDTATVKDREAFFGWIEGDFSERKFYLEARCNKTAVKQALEEGVPPPPGVDYVKIKDVKVRRK